MVAEYPGRMTGNGRLFLAVALITLLAAPTAFSKIQVENFASLQKPVSVTWTGSAFIASSRDSVTRLLKIGTDGIVQSFATAFSGQGEVYVAVSNGKAGFPEGQLFLCTGDSIYQLDPAGNSPRLFSTPAKGKTINYLAFDTDGAWGFLLYALNASGQLWAIGSTGQASLVVNLGVNLVAEGIAVAPPTFGGLAGDMVISMEGSHKVVAIPKNSPSTLFTLATFPGEAPERVLFIPSSSDLFVAKYDQGAVVRIAASNFASYAGSLLVITEGEAGQTGSLSVLKAVGMNVTVSTLFQDPTSPHFEGAAFVPSRLTMGGSSTRTTGVASLPQSTPPLYTELAAVVVAAGAAVTLGIFVARRRRSHG